MATFSLAVQAECASVGMMGGCLPSEGMVDVPNHMKAQTANRSSQPKKADNSQAANKQIVASKKPGASHMTVATSAQNIKQ